MTGAPRISVVVLSRDRRQELLRTLERLVDLPGSPPVIVVDNGSSDGSAARVAAAFPGVELLALARNEGAAARTLGARAARTEFVAFSDDDSWWDAGALERAAEIFDAHPTVGLLAARVLVGPDNRLDPTCDAMAASPLSAVGLPGPRILGFVACGSVVRRSAYLQVGGFNPRYGIGGEEALLASDMAFAGWDLVYVDELVAHHHPSTSRDRRMRRRGLVRNDLWSVWLRRPWHSGLRQTAALVSAARSDVAAARGVIDAVAGLPWVLRERRTVPDGLEADMRRLDRERRLGPRPVSRA